MSHVHVCLVSEQTIPNILSVYHFKPDELLFVTTKKMEDAKKIEYIIQALSQLGLDFKSQFQKVVVQEDSLFDCKKKLDEWICGREGAEFTVNLTCGTKIMSIAVYEYFKDYGSRMIYIPVGKNEYITPFPKNPANATTPLVLRMSVADYLSAYGLKITNFKKLEELRQDAQKRQELSKWIVANYTAIKPLLERFREKLRKHRDDRQGYKWSTTYVPQNEQEIYLLETVGFVRENESYSKHLSRSDLVYMTGGWLEEFCYNGLLNFKGHGIDDIVLGIIPEKGRTKNEFDIMFTKDNSLYTIECKSLDQNDDPKADALYKIAALQKDFGLRVESFLSALLLIY